MLADVRFALGRALWPKARSRVAKLVDQAAQGYQLAGEGGHEPLIRLQAWVARHELRIR